MTLSKTEDLDEMPEISLNGTFTFIVVDGGNEMLWPLIDLYKSPYYII